MSNIKFSAPQGPGKEESFITESEYKAICNNIMRNQDIVEDLKNHARFVSKWRKSEDTNIGTWIPDCNSEIKNIIEFVTNRPNAGRLSVYVFHGLMNEQGWIDD